MKYFLILTLSLLFASCYPSLTNSGIFKYPTFDAKYLPHLDPGEEIVFSQYHYVITRLPNYSYRKRTFFPETMTLTDDVRYSSNELKTKNGPFYKYSDQGILTAKGNFQNNKRIGTWMYYDRKTGELFQEGSFVNGEKIGLWKEYKNGVLSKETQFENGDANGEFRILDSLGNVINFGIYKDGEIIKQDLEIQTNVNNNEVMYIVEESPYLSSCKEITDKELREKCSSKTLLKYVYSNIKYPKLAREYGIEGQVIAQFVIDKNGDVTDIEIIRGVCQDMKDECLKVIQNLPSWEPGIQNNEVVKVRYTLPIKFKLE